MRLHPREQIVRAASLDLSGVLLEWMRRHAELTYIEQAMVMAENTSIQSPLKFALRIERHGDDQAPGGLAE